MTEGRWRWVAVLCLGWLAGCGGGSSSSAPVAPLTIDRIEPLDTAAQKSALAANERAVVASRMPAGAAVAHVALGPLVQTKRALANGKNVAFQIGTGREVALTATPDGFARQLHWYRLADGAQVAAIEFSAEGAQALRLGVRAEQLPPGAVLRFYGANGASSVRVSAAEMADVRRMNEKAGVQGDAARLYWGPDIAGPATTLEIELPAGTSSDQLRIAVPELSHLTQTVQQALDRVKDTTGIGAAGACNIDVACHADVDAESRAVARAEFTVGGSTFLCTGTLLNDSHNSEAPYFLTAGHCISDQAAASTLITNWFFRPAACGSSPKTDAKAVALTGGAVLLSTLSTIDSTLLRLRDQPPADVVFAGSYFGASSSVGDSVFDISNPLGDLQKVSFGTIQGYFDCPSGSGACSQTNVSQATSYQVKWSQGTTEEGSSGSALFANLSGTDYVVGTLHGGSTSCQNPSGSDFFGRFDRSFASGFRNWLVPQ